MIDLALLVAGRIFLRVAILYDDYFGRPPMISILGYPMPRIPLRWCPWGARKDLFRLHFSSVSFQYIKTTLGLQVCFRDLGLTFSFNRSGSEEFL